MNVILRLAVLTHLRLLLDALAAPVNPHAIHDVSAFRAVNGPRLHLVIRTMLIQIAELHKLIGLCPVREDRLNAIVGVAALRDYVDFLRRFAHAPAPFPRFSSARISAISRSMSARRSAMRWASALRMGMILPWGSSVTHTTPFFGPCSLAVISLLTGHAS